MEQDRSLTRVGALQGSNHRIALADLEELVSIVVERDDPGDLGECQRGIRGAAEL